MSFNGLALYFQTLPHLRPVQVLYRARYALPTRLIHMFGTNLRTNSVAEEMLWNPVLFKTTFPSYPVCVDTDIEKGTFHFLNQHQCFGNHIDWNGEGQSRLWRYNLHYFQYLNRAGGLAKDLALRLMRDWVDRNPPGTADAWDPFPISLRIVNWIKFLSLCGTSGAGSCDDLARSIHKQICSLESSLEYHLLGNHLFKNGKALLFAGLFFKGKGAERWRSKGLRILQRELDEQILPDGGHFERSPMYHTMILEDCLDLLNLFKEQTQSTFLTYAEKLKDVCRKMMRFLLGMLHPDGEIALFNDAAFCIEQPPEDLIHYYEGVTGNNVSRRDGRLWSFPETGYFIMAPKAGDRMIIDCGPVGPDYQPGHSHCDTLSFELSLKGRRIIVDSGCCQYEDSDIRKYNRGNMGHNTVTINGENQSEVWGAHRCARRARPIYAKLQEKADGSLYFDGAHDGYKRLKGRPIHHRNITWRDNEIFIEDRIEGFGIHDIESRLHLHPNIAISHSGQEVMISDDKSPIFSIRSRGTALVEMKKGWYCPEFGLKLECPVLTLNFKKETLPFKTGWHFKIHH